jgi:SAM-dependent methyltransferase
MREPVLQDQIDAAGAYEALFVPALFGQWAPKVADAAQIRPGQRVLDVACGTGILARELSSRTGASGRVAGIDPDAGMIAVARELAPAIEWREGNAESLPFPDQSFDAVVSQFGLMFFTDRRQALHEMWRVLAPGGRLAVAVWDSLENIPAYATEVALLEQVAGRRAADALRAPFVLGNRMDLARVFSAAGMVAGDGSRPDRGSDWPHSARSRACPRSLRDREGTGYVRRVGASRNREEAVACVTRAIWRQQNEADGKTCRLRPGFARRSRAVQADRLRRRRRPGSFRLLSALRVFASRALWHRLRIRRAGGGVHGHRARTRLSARGVRQNSLP